MNTRSRGTSTSSKITNASCSSKRLDSGWSNRLPGAHAVAAEELEPGRRHRDRERQRVGVGSRRAADAAGYTASSSANGARVARIRAPRTTMPCAVSATLWSATSLPAAGASPHRPVDRRMDDRVGQRQVAAAQQLLVGAPGSRRPRSLPSTTHSSLPPGEPGERDVHVVGRAPHDPDAALRDRARRQACRRSRSCARARDQVAHVDRLARLGIGHEADRRRLVLQIEERGDEPRGAREGGMAGDVAHPIVAHPDLAVVLQASEEVLTPACRHAYTPQEHRGEKGRCRHDAPFAVKGARSRIAGLLVSACAGGGRAGRGGRRRAC